jgi:ferritin
MQMDAELEAAFNRQVTMELGSSNAYLQMAAHFEHENLTGMSAWMAAQAEEERNHARMFSDFVLDRGNRVQIGAVEAPRSEFEGVAQVFETALQQERAVTQAIHDLYRLAFEKGDLASYPFLQGFIQEQNEEESTVETILERVRLAGSDSGALLLLDTQLGGRGPEEA